jgi:hypothetical protein
METIVNIINERSKGTLNAYLIQENRMSVVNVDGDKIEFTIEDNRLVWTYVSYWLYRQWKESMVLEENHLTKPGYQEMIYRFVQAAFNLSSKRQTTWW